MKTRLSLIAIASIIFLTACTKDDVATEFVSARIETNVAYGSDPLQKFDYILPAGRTTASTKSFIFIHGGGWQEGDKTDYNQFIDTFRVLFPNYAFFNINYRLYQNATGTNKFPTQETDVKSAIDFIYAKRGEYGVADKFVLLGASAGGHLAMLQAYKYNNPKIKAVVNYFGPADMADMYNNPASPLAPKELVAALLGGTPSTQASLYASSSPINFVSTQSAPTITFQGGIDPLIKPAQQTALHAKLNTAGVTNQYVLYPNESHGWIGANLTDSYLKIKAFVTANVQ